MHRMVHNGSLRAKKIFLYPYIFQIMLRIVCRLYRGAPTEYNMNNRKEILMEQSELSSIDAALLIATI